MFAAVQRVTVCIAEPIDHLLVLELFEPPGKAALAPIRLELLQMLQIIERGLVGICPRPSARDVQVPAAPVSGRSEHDRETTYR